MEIRISAKVLKDFCKANIEIMDDENLTLKEVTLMNCLFRFHNCEKGYAFPTYETIMKVCRFGRRATVSATIKSLKAKGYIEVIKTVGNKSLYFLKKHLYLIDRKKTEISKKTNKQSKKSNKKQSKKVTETPRHNSENDVVSFTREHQDKISLLLKQGIKMTEKQEWLLSEFDFEVLREALRLFKRKSRTNSFSFLISCYYTACEKYNIIPSIDIQRYSGNMFFKETEESKDYREFMSEMEKIYS